MADEKKTYLINIESNLKEYIELLKEAKKANEENKKAVDDLSKGQFKSKDQIELTNAAYRNSQKEVKNATKLVDLATQANKAQSGSYEQLYRQHSLLQTALKLESDTMIKNTDGTYRMTDKYIQLSKEVDNAKKGLDSFGKGIHNNTLNVGTYSEAIEGAMRKFSALPGPIGAAAGGITRMTTAAKAFIATPIGFIIAALAAAIGALTSYFKRSEEGQNAFTKVMKVLGSILTNILDVVSKLGKALFEAFTSPKEAIKAIGEFIQVQITNRIQALKDIGAAVMKIFSKDWKQGFKELGESTVQLVTGVDDFVGKVTDGVKGFIKDIKEDVNSATILADKLAQFAKNERRELIENARLAKQSAALRAESEKIKFTDAAKSIALMEQALIIDEKILTNELNSARRKAANAKESARLSGSTIEILDNIAQLDADIENKQAALEEKKRQRIRTINFLKREAFNQEKERLTSLFEIEKYNVDATIAANDKIIKNDLYTYAERLKALEDNQKLREGILKKQADFEIAEVDKDLELETISKENAEVKKLAIAAKYGSLQLQVVSDTVDGSIKLIDDGLKFEDDRRAINAKNKLDLMVLNNASEFDIQRKKLDDEYNADIFAAKKNHADIDIINKKHAAAEAQIDKLEYETKLMLVADFAGNLANLLGEQTALGKMAAIAQATINTYLAASKAYTAMAGIPPAPVWGVIAAATAVAAGISTVKKIMEVKSGLPGDSVGGSLPTAISSSAPSQRTFAQSAGSTIFTQPQLSQTQLNALPQQGLLTAADIAMALSKLPAPIVTVEDINAKTAEVKKVSVRATI